jgi:S-adenosylmethionine hydrolase
MARPLIALVTDFGLRDHYAGTMKGVALGICPDITFVDISHEIPAHDVLAGAFELAASYRYFPAGTIFLVVVDPGVGSSRRGIAVEAGDFRFIAPDNGVLTMVLDEVKPSRVVELTDRRYARPTITRTFEGRDRFAPAAAWLAKGVQLTALGRPAGSLVRLDVPAASIDASGIAGEVLRVDRFGNLITNIGRTLLDRLGERVVVTIGAIDVPRVVSTYADAGDGEICTLVGSSDHLEVAVNGASAAARLGLGRGSVVRVRRVA